MMRLRCDSKQLAIAAARLASPLSDRTDATLSLRFRPGQLSLAASERVLATFVDMEADSSCEATFFVQGGLFCNIVRQMPHGPIDLIVEGGQLQLIAHGTSEIVMRLGLRTDFQWPEEPTIQGDEIIQFEAHAIAEALDKVSYAVQEDCTRAYGTVYFLHVDHKLRLVGTDGYRLAYANLPGENPTNGLTLSRRIGTELRKLAAEGFEKIDLRVGRTENLLCLSVPGTRIYARMSKITYPDYRAVLPTAKLKPIRLKRDDLQATIRRVLLAADQTHVLRLYFSSTGMTVESNTSAAEGREHLRCAGQEEVKIGLNGMFLTEALNVITSQEIDICFLNDQQPILLLPVDDVIDSVHVIVPIQEHVV